MKKNRNWFGILFCFIPQAHFNQTFILMDHSKEVTSPLELLARGAITNSQRHYSRRKWGVTEQPHTWGKLNE